jgi:hypothetical protein
MNGLIAKNRRGHPQPEAIRRLLELALIQSAGLPKMDDVDRDRPNENGHPVLKIDPEKGEVPR